MRGVVTSATSALHAALLAVERNASGSTPGRELKRQEESSIWDRGEFEQQTSSQIEWVKWNHAKL